MKSANSSDVKKSERRSIKVKNLEEVVEAICSQDEGDEECNTIGVENEMVSKTPSRTNRIKDMATPRASQTVLQEFSQTPRRSCRKSIKPSQDYEDIINKSLRSVKKQLLVTSKEQDENHDEIVQPKWTPAKVGRVSQKRGRKQKRTVKEIYQNDADIKQLGERTICDEKTEILENSEKFLEKIVEQHENIDKSKNNDKKQEDNYNIEILENSQPIGNEIIIENLSEKEKNEEVDVENPNLTVENKDCQENKEKQEQHAAEEIDSDDETDDKSKDTNESIHIIQEDSEDFEKLTDKSEQEEICIIYESNISNRVIKEEIKDDGISHSNKISTLGEKSDDSFGCYLKSKEINISDLGLNPLKDEEEEKYVMDNEKKKSSQDVDEMPSLIVCDDDDDSADDNEKNVENSGPCNKLNEGNDSVTFVECDSKQPEDVMETLELSDDDAETPRKRIRIVLTDTELQDRSILTTPKVSAKKEKLPSTPKTLTTPKFSATRKQNLTPFRFPTPFRKNNFKFNDEVKENIKNTPSKDTSNPRMISVTTLEPKEIVLRGIRKRSLSVCIDGNDRNRQKFLDGPFANVKKPERVVSFYSPANQTKFTDDLDIIIEKSVKKQKSQKELGDKFVTTRRKRSLSLDESTLNYTSLSSKLPRAVVCQNISNTQSSSSTSKPLSRTKLPNFAAIHQKQFTKMENLVEHVNRKQERSKNLINSATKLKPASAQKNASATKSYISTVKPKAIKKIDLGTVSQIANLPNPRIAIVKPLKSGPVAHKKPQNQQQVNKYLKPSQATNIEKHRLNTKTVALSKPAFNLSTSVMVKPTTSNYAEKANTSHMSSNEKMANRLQRHMDLFKGRAPSTRAGTASRRNEVILKGVRSNRRFELQMQHRKNLEQ